MRVPSAQGFISELSFQLCQCNLAQTTDVCCLVMPPSRQHDGNMTEIGIPPLQVVRPDFDQMNPKKGSSCCSCDEGEWLPETKGSGAI